MLAIGCSSKRNCRRIKFQHSEITDDLDEGDKDLVSEAFDPRDILLRAILEDDRDPEERDCPSS